MNEQINAYEGKVRSELGKAKSQLAKVPADYERTVRAPLSCVSSLLDPRTRFAGVVFEIVVWLGAAIATCAKSSSRNRLACSQNT